jgi:hypothetical protein
VGGKPCFRLAGAHRDPRFEAPEACKRLTSGWLPDLRCRRRFQQVAKLELERRDTPQAAAFDLGQDGVDLSGPRNRQAIDESLETPCSGRSLRGPPVFKECEESRVYLRFR